MTPVAVVLAAGEGRRAGGYKPLWPLGDGLVVDAVIAAAGAVCQRVRVVGGSRIDELEQHLAAHHPEVELVPNPGWVAGGMFSSVQLGLAGVDGAAFVHPCDVPGAGAHDYRALLEALDPTAHDAARPVHGGRGGHPLLLAPATVAGVIAAPSGSNLREVLAGRRLLDVEVGSDLPCLDFDTREGYTDLRARLEARRAGGDE